MKKLNFEKLNSKIVIKVQDYNDETVKGLILWLFENAQPIGFNLSIPTISRIERIKKSFGDNAEMLDDEDHKILIEFIQSCGIRSLPLLKQIYESIGVDLNI
jgi:hypothetical protein